MADKIFFGNIKTIKTWRRAKPGLTAKTLLAMGLFLLAALVSGGCGLIGPGRLKIISGDFLSSPNGPRQPQARYFVNENIHLRLKVKGFKLQQGDTIWLEEDLKVLDNKMEVVTWTDAEGYEQRLDFPRLLDKNQKLEGLIKTAEINNKLEMPPDAGIHRYHLEVTIRDRVGGTSDTRRFTFSLKAGQAGDNERR